MATEDTWLATNVTGGFDLSDKKQILAGAQLHTHGLCERGQLSVLHLAQTTLGACVLRFAPAGKM